MARQENNNRLSRRDLFKITGSACLLATGIIAKDAVDKVAMQLDADYETREQQGLKSGAQLIGATVIGLSGYLLIDRATKSR